MWLFQSNPLLKKQVPEQTASPFSNYALADQSVQLHEIFFCGWDYHAKPLPPLGQLFGSDPKFLVQDERVLPVADHPPKVSVSVQGIASASMSLPSYLAGSRAKAHSGSRAQQALADVDARLREYGEFGGGERIVIPVPIELAGTTGAQFNDQVKDAIMAGVKRSIAAQVRVSDVDAYLASKNIEIEVRPVEVSGPAFAASVLKLDLDANSFVSLRTELAGHSALPAELKAQIRQSADPAALAALLRGHEGAVQFDSGYQARCPVLDRVFDLSRSVLIYNPVEYHTDYSADEIRLTLKNPPAEKNLLAKRFEQINGQKVWLLYADLVTGTEMSKPCKFIYRRGDKVARVCSEDGRTLPLSSFLRDAPVGYSIAVSADGLNVDYRLFKTGEKIELPPNSFGINPYEQTVSMVFSVDRSFDVTANFMPKFMAGLDRTVQELNKLGSRIVMRELLEQGRLLASPDTAAGVGQYLQSVRLPGLETRGPLRPLKLFEPGTRQAVSFQDLLTRLSALESGQSFYLAGLDFEGRPATYWFSKKESGFEVHLGEALNDPLNYEAYFKGLSQRIMAYAKGQGPRPPEVDTGVSIVLGDGAVTDEQDVVSGDAIDAFHEALDALAKKGETLKLYYIMVAPDLFQYSNFRAQGGYELYVSREGRPQFERLMELVGAGEDAPVAGHDNISLASGPYGQVYWVHVGNIHVFNGGRQAGTRVSSAAQEKAYDALNALFPDIVSQISVGRGTSQAMGSR